MTSDADGQPDSEQVQSRSRVDEDSSPDDIMGFRNSLSLELPDKHEMRGTTSEILLGCCGRKLWSSAGGSAQPNDLNKSFKVSRLDVFLSHSWHGNAWLKYVTLLLYFNAVPALIVSNLVGVILFVWERSTLVRVLCEREHATVKCAREVTLGYDTDKQLVKPNNFILLVGATVLVVVLVSWHHIAGKLPARLGKFGRSTLFFDKVCIDQFDMDRKKEGIAGLGGYLARSSTILVAWDPTYLSRMWCVYELSVFKYGMQNGKVVFLIISNGGLIAVLGFAEVVSQLLLVLLDHSMPHITLRLQQELDVICKLFSFLWSSWVVLQFVDNLQALDCQLRNFSVKRAQSFCCACDHRDPDTNEALPCDRKLIYRSISNLQKQGGDLEGGLQQFDQLIQTTFKNDIRDAMLGSRIPYTWVLVVGTLSGFASLDFSVSFVEPWWFAAYRYFFWTFTIYPVSIGILLFISHKVLFHSLNHRASRILASICLATCLAFFVQAFVLVNQRLGIRGDWLTVAWIAVQLIIISIFFHRKCSPNTARPDSAPKAC